MCEPPIDPPVMSDGEIIERLEWEVKRLEHIVLVLKNSINMAHDSAEQIEANTRVVNGRVEVWCLGEWYDVETENAEAAEGLSRRKRLRRRKVNQ